MGSENLKALEEIRSLGHQVELAGEANLETIRQRLEWIAAKYPTDPEVQKAAEEMKRLIMSRANRLRWSASATTVPGTLPPGPEPTLSTIEIAPPTIPQGVLSASQIPPPIAPAAPPQIPWKRALWIGNSGRHRAFAADDRRAGERRAQAQYKCAGLVASRHRRRRSDRHHALRGVHPRERRSQVYVGLHADASARGLPDHGVPGWIRTCGQRRQPGCGKSGEAEPAAGSTSTDRPNPFRPGQRQGDVGCTAPG